MCSVAKFATGHPIRWLTEAHHDEKEQYCDFGAKFLVQFSMGLLVFTTIFHQFVQLLEAFYPRFLQIIFGNTVHVKDRTTDQLHCGEPSFTSAMLDWFTFRPIVKELYIIKIANCTYVMRSVKTRRMSHWVLGLILKLKVSSFQNCLNFVSMIFTSKVIIIKWCWVVLYCYILVFLLFQAISQNVVLRHPTGFPRSHHIYWIEMQDVRRIDIQILYLSCLFYTKTNCAEGVPFDCYFVHSKSKPRNLNDIAVSNAHKLCIMCLEQLNTQNTNCIVKG